MIDRRTWPQRFLLSFNLVAIATALALAWLLNLTWEKAASVNRVELSGALTPANPSTPGRRVINILLVGSDSSAGLDPDSPIADGRVGERNGDVIIIAHLDERDGSAALLSLPRDLWLPIAGTSREAKINSAFAVGGPATLIETIEEGFGIPINYYVNVDFAGFEGLVDAVGSVEVFFDAPARDWNSSFDRTQTGFEMLTVGCHSLDPPTALAYVRSRYYQTQDGEGQWITDPLGDLGRIRRQQDFLQRLMQRAIDLGARNPFVLSDLVDAGIDNVSLDQELTPQLLLDIGRTYASFEPGSLDTYSYPATFGTVGANSVLFPLEGEAAPILSLFQGAASDAPSTVRVRVVHDPAQSTMADEFSRQLRLVGFELPDPSAAEADSGLVIRHGVDGRQAASLVLAALDDGSTDNIVLEEVSGLVGRDVVVVVGSTDQSAKSENNSTTTLRKDAPAASTSPTEPAPIDAPVASNSAPSQSTSTILGSGPSDPVLGECN